MFVSFFFLYLNNLQLFGQFLGTRASVSDLRSAYYPTALPQSSIWASMAPIPQAYMKFHSTAERTLACKGLVTGLEALPLSSLAQWIFHTTWSASLNKRGSKYRKDELIIVNPICIMHSQLTFNLSWVVEILEATTVVDNEGLLHHFLHNRFRFKVMSLHCLLSECIILRNTLVWCHFIISVECSFCKHGSA